MIMRKSCQQDKHKLYTLITMRRLRNILYFCEQFKFRGWYDAAFRLGQELVRYFSNSRKLVEHRAQSTQKYLTIFFYFVFGLHKHKAQHQVIRSTYRKRHIEKLTAENQRQNPREAKIPSRDSCNT